MKIAIVGCGSIGLTFAEKLLSNNFKSFKIFGNFKNKYSASMAAGAMLNINSEIDCFNTNSSLAKWKLKNRKLALSAWASLANRLHESGHTRDNLLFGKGTEILLKGNSNKIESESYKAMYNSVFSNNDYTNTSSFIIEDEQSVDSNVYLNSVFTLVSSEGRHVNHNIKRIAKNDNGYQLITHNKEIYSGFTHVFVMAGSWSQQILNQSDDIKSAIKRKSYYGVGSALRVRSELSYVKQPYFDRIIRTPNRGGTCGIHSVQRESELYIGASSVVTNFELKSPRLSSIEALIQGSREVLDLDPYQLSCDVITGYRPVIDDGVPIIGEISTNLFCLFGTKRDGFTWAPAYSNFIYEYYFNNQKNEDFSKLLDIAKPHRELISCGDTHSCIEAYVKNKIFEAYQHGVSLNNKEVNSLYEIATKTHEAVELKFKRSIGLQPELINMFYYVEGYGKIK